MGVIKAGDMVTYKGFCKDPVEYCGALTDNDGKWVHKFVHWDSLLQETSLTIPNDLFNKSIGSGAISRVDYE